MLEHPGASENLERLRSVRVLQVMSWATFVTPTFTGGARGTAPPEPSRRPRPSTSLST